jgi:protease I
MAKVGFVVGEMFEDSELRVPLDKIAQAGHEVVLIGTEAGKQIEGKKHREKITTELGIDDVSADDLDALVIPGGFSPDHLRTNADMVDLVRDMFDAMKPVAAVCHGPSLLIEADVVDGRTLTSWPSVRTDVINAGGNWIDRECVEDGNLITSRNPSDLPAFSAAILRQLEQGPAERIGPPEIEEFADTPM